MQQEREKKKVQVRENRFYQSRKYNFLINIFNTLGYNHCLKKKKRPNILIINEVGTCMENFLKYWTNNTTLIYFKYSIVSLKYTRSNPAEVKE